MRFLLSHQSTELFTLLPTVSSKDISTSGAISTSCFQYQSDQIMQDPETPAYS